MRKKWESFEDGVVTAVRGSWILQRFKSDEDSLDENIYFRALNEDETTS